MRYAEIRDAVSIELNKGTSFVMASGLKAHSLHISPERAEVVNNAMNFCERNIPKFEEKCDESKVVAKVKAERFGGKFNSKVRWESALSSFRVS